jgi:hypothetical protein
VLPLVDDDLGQVGLIEEVDVVRALDGGPLELNIGVEVDRGDRHGTVLAEELLLELVVDLVPGVVVLCPAGVLDQLVVLRVAVVRRVVPRLARPELEEVDRSTCPAAGR